jgi:spermidine synthase
MRRNALLLGIFTLSGAAGLIYEIVWSRQLVLVFGNTTQAISAILTGFFAGLAIGAVVGGRIADRVRSPLRMYGILEILLVAVVLVTPVSFRLIHEVYRGIYPSIEGTAALPLLRLVLAVVAVSPATIMMGATFPSLVRHFTRSAQLSHSFGRLYAANTFGAIVGTLVAGLALIEILGLSGALTVGAGCSFIAGISAVWLSRTDPQPVDRAGSMPVDNAESSGRPSRPSRMRLALTIAFISGLTSLGYQVTWTRLLASGTGNTTYVFTVILGVFLAGIAIGAMIFNVLRPRLRDPIRVLALTQVLLAAFVIIGLVTGLTHPNSVNPNHPIETVISLLGSAVRTILPATIVLGIAFPISSALLREDGSEPGTDSGSLLAVNTTGAILGSLIVPFILMPTIGSPAVLALLAAINGGVGIWLGLISRPRGMPSVLFGFASLIAVVAVVAVPGLITQPNAYLVVKSGGDLFASTEDEIASVQAGETSLTPQLWVAGTAMTVLTVDAKLMPILPLIARPGSRDALVVAFGMGTAFRSALIAGLHTDVVELVPSVPGMFPFYYSDAADVLADPNGHVIIADGRNHLELTDNRYDIIVTDPPPPIESSGASVISSREYYEAGRMHLTADGIMMEWVPYGQTIDEFKTHVRAFASVFPQVTIVFGPGGYGTYMLGSSDPVAFDPDAIRTVLARPGILDDISSAYDSPTRSVDGWIAEIDQLTWISGSAVARFAGDGPMVTDDRPLSEYFLLRRLGGTHSPIAVPSTLRAATVSGG